MRRVGIGTMGTYWRWKAINAAGGVTIQDSSSVKALVILDDESDPTKTVQHMETLYSDEGVVAYLGGFGG